MMTETTVLKRLAAIEKKLDVLHKRERGMSFHNATRAQRQRVSAQINELCAERNSLRGMPVRERMSDRSI